MCFYLALDQRRDAREHGVVVVAVGQDLDAPLADRHLERGVGSWGELLLVADKVLLKGRASGSSVRVECQGRASSRG